LSKDSPAKLLDRGFERGEEHFAGFTAIEVLFEFLANRGVQLLVEIVGELREQSFTGRPALHGGFGVRNGRANHRAFRRA
jgi:hypothetical protein